MLSSKGQPWGHKRFPSSFSNTRARKEKARPGVRVRTLGSPVPPEQGQCRGPGTEHSTPAPCRTPPPPHCEGKGQRLQGRKARLSGGSTLGFFVQNVTQQLGNGQHSLLGDTSQWHFYFQALTQLIRVKV